MQTKTIMIERVKCSLDHHGHLVLEMPRSMFGQQLTQWRLLHRASILKQLSTKKSHQPHEMQIHQTNRIRRKRQYHFQPYQNVQKK
jgi:hypothetical protein